ncbi:MAG: hypothetical protein GF418_05865 [Chitinivibrionales bacterium]|nr:hypothetical protein [Chitinivibrionales bacterium]MBD3395137.1 hypothetical protein [Chitinivibrionales bacterium]
MPGGHVCRYQRKYYHGNIRGSDSRIQFLGCVVKSTDGTNTGAHAEKRMRPAFPEQGSNSKVLKLMSVFRFSRADGFTLVEGIVVGVIIAILAAVAIPIYTGYVQQSRSDAVSSLAESAAAAADIYFRKTGADPSLNDLQLHYSAAKYNVAIDAIAGNVTVTMIGKGVSNSVSYK